MLSREDVLAMQEQKGSQRVYVGLPAAGEVRYYLIQSRQHPSEVAGVLFYGADVENGPCKRLSHLFRSQLARMAEIPTQGCQTLNFHA